MAEKKNKTVESFDVGTGEEGLRLDVFCASRIASLSRNQIQKLNKAGGIEVNGVVRPDHYVLRHDERVRVVMPLPPSADREPEPQKLALRIVYQDDDVLVINKQAGLVVHPAHGNWDGTVVNGVLGMGIRLSTLGSPERPGVVHRLDKDTSGLMVLAKSDEAYHALVEQIKKRMMEKTYHAIVWGNLGARRQTIDAPIARHPVDRQRMSIARRGGREALTEVLVVDSFEYFDYIRVVTVTGRTHQIRVHLEHVSHPILGDPVYGGRRKKGLPSNARIRKNFNTLLKVMTRQALTASKLSFEHPVKGGWLSFTTAVPEDMRLALEMLHRENWN